MKKLVSLLMAAIMVLSMMSFISFASAEEEIVHLKWAQGNGPAPIDNDIVVARLNEISREAIGVEVQIDYMTSDEMQLVIANGGEGYDIFYSCSWFNNYFDNVSKGTFANLWGKIQEWTPDLFALLPEEWWEMARSADGGLYGVVDRKDVAGINSILYDPEIAKAAGIEVPSSISAWDEMTPYLTALQSAMDADPTLGKYAVNVGGAPAGMESSFDFIDRIPLIGVIFGTTKVVSVFDDPGVTERYYTMHKWNQMGFVNPDAATLDENSIDSKLHHIGFTQAWTGYSYYGSRGFSTEYARYAGPVLSTDLLLGSLQCISAALEEDEARFKKALQFLELLCTNKEYRDTIGYGIEGVHFNYYDVNDIDGNYLGKAVVRTELGRSNYGPWNFNQGNYSLLTPAFALEEVEHGHPLVNQWDLYYKEIEGAPVSTIAGFQFNNQEPIDFTQAYTEIANIKAQYFSAIQCGAVDPDDPELGIPAMRAKMEAAGLNDIIAEAQRQLDEYLASK